jgi:CheY-like chemotaxis protein
MHPRLRVLVVDDDQHVRSATVCLLTRMGYEAAEADDGPAGIVALRHAADSGQV